ncbi:MAG: phosphatase PAP2 family protein [Armatimonadota bacterium]|nr:phosphatase PAP2 family protein [Armatimonadota bacterium]
MVESWGLALVRILQQLSPWLDTPMRLLSLLGQEEAYLIVVVLLYWCVDARWGSRALAILLVSVLLNDLAKWLFHAPRPYWVDPQVKALSLETSYGVPSGHAQTGVAFWGYHAATIGRRRAWVAAAALVLLVSISRVYLGVHFPHDVVVGWCIGAGILAAFLRAEPAVSAWLTQRARGVQVAAVLGASVGLLAIVLVVRATLGDVVDPPAWATQAAAAAGGGNHPPAATPRSLASIAAVLGALLGAGLGATARGATVRTARAPLRVLLARVMMGVAGLLVIRAGLAVIFPSGEDAPALLFRWMRYAMMGAWVIWLAPVVFTRTGLTEGRGP